jgi:hypothetical protein
MATSQLKTSATKAKEFISALYKRVSTLYKKGDDDMTLAEQIEYLDKHVPSVGDENFFDMHTRIINVFVGSGIIAPSPAISTEWLASLKEIAEGTRDFD